MKITVDPEINQVLQRLADAMGKKRATIVSEFLEQALPSFARLADVLEAARAAPEIAQRRLARSLLEAADESKSALGDMLNQIDAFDDDLKRTAEMGARRGEDLRSTTAPPSRRKRSTAK